MTWVVTSSDFRLVCSTWPRPLNVFIASENLAVGTRSVMVVSVIRPWSSLADCSSATVPFQEVTSRTTSARARLILWVCRVT